MLEAFRPATEIRRGAEAGLRVIAGKYRRRRLHSVKGNATRPMLGRMRQQMFDILQGSVEGRTFADLYAGSGAVGIEALSRGAVQVQFVEASRRAAGVIRKNLAAVKAAHCARVHVARVHEVLDRIRADTYFLGPPYAAHMEYTRTLRMLSTRSPDWVIAQHSLHLALPEHVGDLERVRLVRVGSNRLSMYRPCPASESGADG